MNATTRLALYYGILPPSARIVARDRLWRIEGEAITGGHTFAEIGVVHRIGTGSDPDSAAAHHLAELAGTQLATATRHRRQEQIARDLCAKTGRPEWGVLADVWGMAATVAELATALLTGDAP